MTIHPDQQTDALIQSEIDAGHFKDPDAVVQKAVQPLAAWRLEVGLSREKLDASLDAAIEALERGEGDDGDPSLAELEREENEMRRR